MERATRGCEAVEGGTKCRHKSRRTRQCNREGNGRVQTSWKGKHFVKSGTVTKEQQRGRNVAGADVGRVTQDLG